MDDEGSDMIAQFCAITGAPAHIGENYLLAHDWHLERAVDFYMDHPPQEAGAASVPDPFGELPAAGPGVPAAQPDIVEIPDDHDEAAGLNELAWQRESPLAGRQQAEQEMEGHGLRAPAAAAAAGPSSRPRRGNRSPVPADSMDMDQEDMVAIAAAVTGAGEGAALPGEQYSSLHRHQQQQMLEHYHQLARQRQVAAAAVPPTPPFRAAAAAGGGLAEDGDEEAAAGAAEIAAAGVGDDLPLDLPEGINLEEARMLEAAMLGIPYQGRMPDFSNAAAAAAAGPPLSPGAMEQRSLRAEQDAAYEESLALDRAKQESIAAAQAAVEAQEHAEREAAEAAARAEADAAQALAELLQDKQQRLEETPEPPPGKAGCFTIVVRLPDGSRKGRRFRPSDQLQAVFDFVDVQCAGTEGKAAGGRGSGGGGGRGGGGSSSEGSGGSVKPGGYRLVTQFPRKVYVEGSLMSLADAGITSDSALFIEQL